MSRFVKYSQLFSLKGNKYSLSYLKSALGPVISEKQTFRHTKGSLHYFYPGLSLRIFRNGGFPGSATLPNLAKKGDLHMRQQK